MSEYYLREDAPYARSGPVVKPGEFVFAAAALEHPHIWGMCLGLIQAGATLKYVWDPDPKKVQEFLEKVKAGTPVDSIERILEDPEIRLVAAAGIPNERAALGIRVMEAGKDYYVDKAPMTTLAHVEAAREACARTGHRYFVDYSERLRNKASLVAGEIVRSGEIGEVVQLIGTGPHRHFSNPRPDWFYNHEQYGGILVDIGSHQTEQFLYFTGNTNATVLSSKVGNYANPQFPELEDFGDATLLGDNGATGYFRVDWLTGNGLRTWGDGRLIIMGTKGHIELRKYIDITREPARGNHVYLVNDREEKYIDANPIVKSYPIFAGIINDSLQGTEDFMTQDYIFRAAELCIRAQMQAIRVR